MVSFSPERCTLLTLLLVAPVLATAQELPILLDAASTDFDRRNQKLLFEEVSITRGELGIAADQADSSQLDFADSTWVFRGDVVISSPQARVSAEKATMRFVDHRLQTATITGAPAVLRYRGDASMSIRANEAVVLFGDNDLQRITLSGLPAEFEHQAAADSGLTSGKAKQLVYDLSGERVQLLGDAWIIQGDNEIRGEEITYDVIAQRVVAGSSNDSDRVRITITPPANDDKQ